MLNIGFVVASEQFFAPSLKHMPSRTQAPFCSARQVYDQ